MHILDGISPIGELNIDNQRVLVRADFDLDPSVDADELLTLKLQALLPTLQLAAEKEARVIIAGHRGTPTRRDSALSLERVGVRLSELSGWEVFLPDDCLSDAAKRVIGDLRGGQVCLLENLRFHRGEQANDDTFARALAGFCDVYINEAFGCSHQRPASLSALPRLIPVRGSGLWLHQEANALSRIVSPTERPVLGVFGGSADSDDLDVLDLFLRHCDHVCVGGSLGWALLAASGHDLGATQTPAELLPRCRSLLHHNYDKLILPLDVRTASSVGAVPGNTADVKRIPAGQHALDIGPDSTDRFAKMIAAAKTIVYTGSMSTPLASPRTAPTGTLVQTANLATAGTLAVLQSLASAPGFSVITGDQTVMAAVAAGPEVMANINHISLGGDATMAFIAGKRMPGIDALRGASNE
jgi:phosphoglycerate kinase